MFIFFTGSCLRELRRTYVGVYALNDPTDRDYQSQCSHEHRPYCEKCDDLTKTIDDITAAIEALAADELKEEQRFVMGRAKQDIVSWKAHLLRSVNQEEARLDIANELDDTFSSGLGYEVPSEEV